MFIIEEWCTCSIPNLGQREDWAKPRCGICHKFVEPVEELSRMTETNMGKVERVVQEIIQERSTTAIVRENDPRMVERWDNDLVRLRAEHRTTLRASSLQFAINVLNADPNSYASIKSWSMDNPDGSEKPYDFFGKSVTPLADRIYEYITQDQE
jgi:hypothetical protein